MKIEFVIPTYNRTDHLMTIISSIVAQTNPNWTIHVVVDGPTDEIKVKVNNIGVYYQDLLHKIKFTFLEERFNDWGHTPRNYGLSQATEEWVIMTGEDNYYAPTFVENFLTVVEDDVNFVFCNMVHNWVKDNYIPINCTIEFGKIDVGNFMARTKQAQQLRLRTDVPEADWLFIYEYLDKFDKGRIIKIDKILYIHN